LGAKGVQLALTFANSLLLLVHAIFAGNEMLADTELFETAIEYVGAGYVFDQTAIHRHCTLLAITSAQKMSLRGCAGIVSVAPL
jgi:hypothetical protein